MLKFLESLTLSEGSLSNISRFEIGVPVEPNTVAEYDHNTRVVRGGAFNPKHKFWYEIMDYYGQNRVILAVLFIMVHEIGHSVFGNSEFKANEFMKKAINRTYGKNLSWPSHLSLTSVIEMIVRENLI